jgi:GTPase SAR1 family protein
MNNLNLVLLGLPSSGKSALLGSLEQAAQTKGTDLEGALIDPSGDLAKLRPADDKYQPTREAVTAYAVKRRIKGRDETVILHDTSGAEAAALLTGKQKVAAKGALPGALAAADGVLLVVDASSSAAELDKEFRQFIAFLESWQTQRSLATEVGGLPVFLVLSKCDKIARAGETHGQWMQRIEEAKRRVGEQFQAALEESRDLSFGRIDIRVWATAVKRPTADKRANEPFQVAELFQQVFDAAGAFRRRTERSSQTLHGALVGLGGVAALLLLLVTWHYATQPTLDEAALEQQVNSLLAGDNTPAEKVREPIDDRLTALKAVKENPAYAQLPSHVREHIKATEDAIEKYQQLNKEFQSSVRNPRLVTRDSELADIEKNLAAFDDKLKAWPETRLAKRHQEWSADTAVMRQAVKDEEAWAREQIHEGEKLRAAGGLVIAKQVGAAQRDAWFKAVHEFEIRDHRHKGNARIEGTTIPYRVVYKVDRVIAADNDWRQFKIRLGKLREEAREK